MEQECGIRAKSRSGGWRQGCGPIFTDEERTKGLTDFNDLHQSRGLDEVKRQVGLVLQKDIKQEKLHSQGQERGLNLDRYLKFSIEKNPCGFCSFMEAMYFGFCNLLYEYVISHGNIESDEARNLPHASVSPVRHDLDILLGIHSLLYNRYTSDDSVNIAVFALRGYIESWIRGTFDLFLSSSGKYMPISVILDVLRSVSDSSSSDGELKKYINSIFAINNWSNFYIHLKSKTIFWVPFFIELYLKSFSDECRGRLIKDTGTKGVTPPLTQKNSELYNKVREELAKYYK